MSLWQECSEEEDGYSSEEAENEEDEDDTEEAEEDEEEEEEMMVPGMEGKEEVCGERRAMSLESQEAKCEFSDFDFGRSVPSYLSTEVMVMEGFTLQGELGLSGRIISEKGESVLYLERLKLCSSCLLKCSWWS